MSDLPAQDPEDDDGDSSAPETETFVEETSPDEGEPGFGSDDGSGHGTHVAADTDEMESLELDGFGDDDGSGYGTTISE